ncbi:cystathionine beta-lyase [Breznakia sp. PF5-3]|uniref:MalY/PatB family protein n=1 Tax=unclassified Breznakia TaxID=2623764 RepID=UPI0024064B4A|nr:MULTISPECIES: PatB family C-S lyase [unclassified Breznakia]MDF9824348.1 cystathionine beta-lyase [Breznakia sp. PM6-1]MDF9835061.1 cystathionine beta-lyase [Breznakia sp. PF5-3]MDF9837768.1 cystathionine beta-lyase [Breznakia sp. PFB2-8]MDF9859647.1 cystathionine beta-lyase [Breznakia sp. PH5-24]
MVNFDKETNRVHTNAIKWDNRKEVFGKEDVLPLWVADMDFETPKEVIEAMQKRIQHGIFGYTDIPDKLYDAVIDWNWKRHEWKIEKANIVFNNNVLSSINALLRILSKEGDGILMLTPVYFPFFNIVNMLKRVPIYSEMKVVDDRYAIDFDDLEKQIIEQKPKVLLFCNPHNPGGRVWNQEELKKVIELCERYHIEIISDDIHKDIVFPYITYTPMINMTTTYKEHIFTITAPTKIFNIAGIKAAYTIFYNDNMKKRFTLETKKMNYSSLNILAIEATLAAYTKCAYWVDELCDYLQEGYQIIRDGLKNTKFHCLESEGTFLVWIDYRKFNLSSDEMEKRLINAGLGIQMGKQFGEAGTPFFRLNIGTQHDNLHKAVKLLKEVDRAVTK